MGARAEAGGRFRATDVLSLISESVGCDGLARASRLTLQAPEGDLPQRLDHDPTADLRAAVLALAEGDRRPPR